MIHRRFVWIFLSLLLTVPASAASLASFCTLRESKDGVDIAGRDENRRLPIASVSKLMTAWWGLSVKGLEGRYRTRFHVTPVGDGRFDVHIEGTRDPYFGKESLHLALSELHRRGVRRIRLLSFDEGFKFYVNVTSDFVAASFYTTASPQPATVLAQLQSMKGLTNDWEQTQREARARGVRLINRPSLPVEEMRFVSRADFAATVETTDYTLRSAPLSALLKEMNRNSNNHAANQIFENLGGAAAFSRFALQKLNLGASALSFHNGTGDRIDFPNGASGYNEATCAATLKVLRALRQDLKRLGKDLQDVMPVTGGDADSSVSKYYENDETRGSLIGKTGTVNPSITLAGLVHTRRGEYLFMYNVSTNGTAADWNRGRALIREKITGLIRELNGGDPIRYTSVSFLSFDQRSVFEVPAADTERLP
ncbi:MAG: D-alanyl-D-alanine carboxypeptidase [Bdellovibrionaceae bacterium]|nr:D-alanyl-D-alanine carboxypeptidase [Pseudobdellovibrionaceae bacterium]